MGQDKPTSQEQTSSAQGARCAEDSNTECWIAAEVCRDDGKATPPLETAGKATPPLETPPDTKRLAEFVPQFKALGHPTRAAIVEQLLGGERCVCEITAQLGMSQPLVSHHLALLRDTGFVCARGAGARTYYSLDWQRFSDGILSFIATVEELHRHDNGPSCVCG
jgi:DNA-binding transcriptional ArsR family regulator